MNKLILVLAAAATLALAVPASAQVRIETGPGGVEVGVGREHDAEWRRHHPSVRGAYAKDCRVEKTQVTTPSGRTITKTVRHCD